MATGWKRWIEMGLVRGGLPRLALRRRSRDVAILAYHNIVPTGESVAGDRSLHVDQADFARQLDLILQYAEVIPLSDIDVPSSGSRLRVVITFDDAYRGAMTAGLAELERRGLPSTVFVPTGLMGGEASGGTCSARMINRLIRVCAHTYSGSSRVTACGLFGGPESGGIRLPRFPIMPCRSAKMSCFTSTTTDCRSALTR